MRTRTRARGHNKPYRHVRSKVGNPNITLLLMCDLPLGINFDRGARARACARARARTGILNGPKTSAMSCCIRRCQLLPSTISRSQLMLELTHTHTHTHTHRQLCFIYILAAVPGVAREEILCLKILLHACACAPARTGIINMTATTVTSW